VEPRRNSKVTLSVDDPGFESVYLSKRRYEEEDGSQAEEEMVRAMRVKPLAGD
jgi:hypothetical protein